MGAYEKEWGNPKYKFLSYPVDGLNWNIHFHESFEICFMLCGAMNIGIDKKVYKLHKNDAVIIFPRQIHSYESIGNSTMHIITFMPGFVPDFSNEYKNKVPADNTLKNFVRYKDNLNPPNDLAQKGLLYSILGTLVENTEFIATGGDEESRLLLKMLRFIENEYSGDCSLKEAARRLSYSYSYLSRIFKKLMKMSYTEYLNRYRINRAVGLLTSEKNIQIQEIAIRCGYESLCSFNRNFKAIIGCTPQDMLRKNK